MWAVSVLINRLGTPGFAVFNEAHALMMLAADGGQSLL